MENLPGEHTEADLMMFNDFLIHREEIPILESIFAEIGSQQLKNYLHPRDVGIGISNGYITQIHLKELEQLPKAILKCRHLKNLEISGSIESIPVEIGQILSLEKLTLDLPKMDIFPIEIGQLTNLKTLELYFLDLITELPISLGKAIKLESLTLVNLNNIRSLPESFGNLVNLRELVITRCNSLSLLPTSLKNLKNLVTLELIHLSLLANVDWIEGLLILKSLNLRSLPMLNHLPSKIGQCTHLNRVDIIKVPLMMIPVSLGNCIDIERLVISETAIEEIPESIEKLNNLKHWAINHNHLKLIKGNYEHLQKLSNLSISENKLEYLPKGIEKCRNLRELFAYKNEIRELPRHIGICTSLHWLNVNDNRLTHLPESIGDLERLNCLELENNQIVSLPETIGNLQRLGQLLISNNKLTKLPAAFADLTFLQFLNLDGNPWEYPFDQIEEMRPSEIRAFLKQYYLTHPEHGDSQTIPIEPHGAAPDASPAPAGAEGVVQVVYGYVIPKKGSEVLPRLAITTRRFWDEQHRVPGMGEWESRYFPEELAAIGHVVDALGLDEVVEGIFEFHVSTPEGEARQARALELWKEQKYDELSLLHGEIVEKDLRPALEQLGAVEVPQISEHLRKGYFSQ